MVSVSRLTEGVLLVQAATQPSRISRRQKKTQTHTAPNPNHEETFPTYNTPNIPAQHRRDVAAVAGSPRRSHRKTSSDTLEHTHTHVLGAMQPAKKENAHAGEGKLCCESSQEGKVAGWEHKSACGLHSRGCTGHVEMIADGI